MYYTIFKNQKTGKLWYKKYKTIQNQERAYIAIIKLTYNSVYDTYTSLRTVKYIIKKNNK